jgi:hypothetical protein
LNVLSGVPQGSILGPLLFLIFVNELPNWIVNDMKMFADDTKLWTKISSPEDSESLQLDLDSLAAWSNEWQLYFNPEKCKVMHIGHPYDTKYYMHEEGTKVEVQSVVEEKDLGVYFTRDLKPAKQCIQSAARARAILGMVRRHFRRMDERGFCLLYKTYIRPHLEFSVQAWSPYLRKDIDCLERVQRAATKLVPHLRKLSYEERLEKLRLTSLYDRRRRGDVIETYKILNGKVNVNKEQFFRLSATGHNTRGHSLKLEVQRPRLDKRKFFFSHRVVQQWNSLPQRVVTSVSVNSFKNSFDKFQDMGIKGNA